jgi:hypothetical protein
MSSSAMAPGSSRVIGALVAAPGRAAGALLGAGFGLAARVRRTKPLHPAGQVGSAVLDVTSPAPELGVPLFAGSGRHHCLVRWSRSAGVPSPLPDVEGFALRVRDAGAGRVADLLFASTGEGAVTRYTLRLRGPRSHGPMSTLLPVAGATGSLMFLVEPLDDDDPPRRWRLSVADAGSAWRTLATLTVTWGSDEAVRFDPVLNLLPGTGQYPLVRALREPAYARARSGAAARPS